MLENALDGRARRVGRRLTLALTALVACTTCTLAYATRGTHVKAALTIDEGRALVKAMEPIPNFPVVMNDAVLGRLNYLLTQPGRAEFVKSALQRMEEHRPMIEGRLERHRLPEALLAVPLVESGYQNKVQKPGRSEVGGPMGAGLWMFIKGTARTYGLKVDGKYDQRLDERRETEAAMRYLGANFSRYKDWMLALAAYNMGEPAVDRALETAGYRDAWRLVDSGHINDYIVYVMAGVILIKNPSLLE